MTISFYYTMSAILLQVTLCQKLLFLHQPTIWRLIVLWITSSIHENSKLKPGVNMLCTETVSDIQNNFCTQHILPKEELLTKIYLYWKMVLSVRKCIFAFFVHEICTAIIFLITTLFLSIIFYLPRKIRCQQHSTNLNMPNFGYFHERSTRKLYLRHHFLWCWHPHFVRLLDTKKTATKGQ